MTEPAASLKRPAANQARRGAEPRAARAVRLEVDGYNMGPRLVMGTRMGLKSSLLRKSLAVTFALAAVWALPSNAATVPDLYTVTVVPDPAAADQRAAAIKLRWRSCWFA